MLFYSAVVVLCLCASILSLSVAVDIDIDPKGRTFQIMQAMRDGVKLHNRVVFPRGHEAGTGQKYTTIIDRSPYGGEGIELINDLFVPFGFVTVGQDMRGTGKSEGNFTIWHQDAEDGQDLGNWVVKQPWSNGNVFSFGASADGLAAFTIPQSKPDWLHAQYIVWSASTGYPVIYPNGAYLENLADAWMRSTVPDQADDLLMTVKAHEMQDSWWDPIDLTNKFNLIKWPSNFWAGWYDIFLVGTLHAYRGYNYESDESVRHQSMILIDPLGHCQDAAQYFPQDLIMGRTALSLIQGLQTFGVRPVERSDIKNVTFYVMSSNDAAGLAAGQYWTSLEAFPEPVMTRFYLHGDKTLSTLRPQAEETVKSSTYVYDPANPVPSRGGNNLNMPCGPLDQNDVDSRADVLTFETPAFFEELALTGPIMATLYVSSDAIDTDFMVRVSDVYPTGEARLLQDSAIRMRWREGGLTPVYMSAGNVYEATLSLWNTSYVVAPGHKLRVSVASSNYPRFSVNRNNGELLVSTSPNALVNITAKNTIFHSETYSSYISLPVVDKHLQLPKLNDVRATAKAMFPDLDLELLEKKLPALVKAFRGPF